MQMNELDAIDQRLVQCFQLAIPALDQSAIVSAAQATVPDWDSVATITLVNVIEDEFAIELDLDKLADLDSFARISQYLHANIPA